MKLVGMIGNFIKMDRVIVMKELLSYVRIMVEMLIDKDFFEYMSFGNEWGVICYVFFKYEW